MSIRYYGCMYKERTEIKVFIWAELSLLRELFSNGSMNGSPPGTPGPWTLKRNLPSFKAIICSILISTFSCVGPLWTQASRTFLSRLRACAEFIGLLLRDSAHLHFAPESLCCAGFRPKASVVATLQPPGIRFFFLFPFKHFCLLSPDVPPAHLSSCSAP